MKPTSLLDRALPSSPVRVRAALAAGLAATLVLLLLHVWTYAFLTDDAFISFRYARNLARGDGLVFNPGGERVEGYTNFLWVLLLAGFSFLGIPLEGAAHVLSIGATVGLWALVVRFACRRPPAPGRAWLLLVPPLCLAATRSVAVWSTSGLETRLFELLVVGGVLRAIAEVDAARGGERPPFPAAALLLALATLTRPDGLLISVAVLGIAGLVLWVYRRFSLRTAATALALFAALVGGHLLFRLGYYGEWLPNTYYAKVGGRTWWAMGGMYLAAFCLEYAAVLWLPFVVAAVAGPVRRGTLHVPLLLAAPVVVHALYVAAIGGDHFEYRPLDVYFPLVFLLVYEGAKTLAQSRRGAAATGALLAVLVAGLFWLPWQSHRQYPADYHIGFPGKPGKHPAANTYLSPLRDPLYRLPGLESVARTHLRLLRTLTEHFVAVRQEEHVRFLATVESEGRRFGALVRAGTLPPDTHIATDSIGALAYYSDLRVLDRLGLTDARVAHAGFRDHERLMAHAKRATFEYAQEAGVDFWFVHTVHGIWNAADLTFLTYLDRSYRQGLPFHVAELEPWEYLAVRLPQGIDHARRRFPALDFRESTEPALYEKIMAEAARRGAPLERL